MVQFKDLLLSQVDRDIEFSQELHQYQQKLVQEQLLKQIAQILEIY